MKKSDSRSSRGGFTLIEVVVSTALLAVVCTGFLMMTAANTSQLSGEQSLERSNYDLSARAGVGEGDPTGETMRWSSAWRKRMGAQSMGIRRIWLRKYLNSTKSLSQRKIQATI